MSEKKLEKIDKNMKIPEKAGEELEWRHAYEKPFELAGFKYFEEDRLYWRLPAKPSRELPDGPAYLRKQTAGGQVRFQTSSKKIAVRGELVNTSSMHHMPATGQSGFDLYLGAPGEQRFYNNTKIPPNETKFSQDLMILDSSEKLNCTINFPLYNEVKSVEIGLEPGAEILPPPPYADEKSVIVYGTSITQGGCAGRPGMAWTNILSRKLNLEFVNLGFSGSGRGEPEMAEIITEMPCEPLLYILDYEANCVSPERFAETLPEFIDILRGKYPLVPILVLSKIKFPAEAFLKNQRERYRKQLEMQKELVKKRREAGDENIFFFDGCRLLDDSFYDECTVDGVHPNDLGFFTIARNLEPEIRKILSL